MKNFGLLKGSKGQILPCDEKDEALCKECVCIVMERGVISMDKYLLTHQDVNHRFRLGIVEHLINILINAQYCGVVLMDFKFSNVIRVLTQDGDVFLKAIDFGSACSEADGDVISGDTTPAYSCPEIANYMLVASTTASDNTTDGETSIRSPKASHKMDIMALGWAVFELMNGESYWKSLSLEKDVDILKALSKLKDEEVAYRIEDSFPGDKLEDLRSWLRHALKVNPNERYNASKLKTHHLFGPKDPTTDKNSIIAKLDAIHIDVMKTNSTLDKMTETLIDISNKQNDFGLMIRQVIVEDSEENKLNHQEVKSGLKELEKLLSSKVKTLKEAPRSGKKTNTRNRKKKNKKRYNLEEMKELVHKEVSDSLESLKLNLNLTDDVKDFLMETLHHCNEASQVTKENRQLDTIIKTLSDLQSDVSNVMSEVKEVRGDIEQVNQSLKIHFNMMSTLINQNHNSPLMFIVLPAKPSGILNSVKSIFTKEMLIFFVCPVTKKPVKSGEDGKGYRMLLPTKLVQTVAPVIAMTFTVIDIALKIYGIPLPTLPFPSHIKSDDLTSYMMDEMHSAINTGVEGAAEIDEFVEERDSTNEVIEICKEAVAGGGGKTPLSDEKKKRLDEAMLKASEASFKETRKLLMDLEKCDPADRGANWTPKFTGLFQVRSNDGKTAWVSKEAIKKYPKTYTIMSS